MHVNSHEFGIFGGPCIFDVSKLFPMNILLITLLDGPLLKPKIGLPKNPMCPILPLNKNYLKIPKIT